MARKAIEGRDYGMWHTHDTMSRWRLWNGYFVLHTMSTTAYTGEVHDSQYFRVAKNLKLLRQVFDNDCARRARGEAMAEQTTFVRSADDYNKAMNFTFEELDALIW